MTDETKGMLYGILGVAAFGLTLPFTRLVVPYLDPIFIGTGRAVVSALVAAVILLAFKQKIPNKAQIIKLSIVSLGVVAGFPILSSWAMQYVPASHGGVVLGILPLATAIFGAWVSKERPSMAFWLVSLIGSALVVVYVLTQGSGALQMADLALLGAIISAAIGYAVGGQLSKSLGGWQVICWALILSLVYTLPLSIIYAPETFIGYPIEVYISFSYLALVSMLTAFFAWYKGLVLGGIARVSQTQLLQPFITIFASIFMLSEPLDFKTILFAVLVVASVWIGKKMPIG
ncbi:MAG: DMT family transporter [OCS116 cluster bacterium]|nr:DMT family transporter [OCS116 cluster bacterium]